MFRRDHELAEHDRVGGGAEPAARQRAVIVLRYYEDLTEVETAAALGLRVGTVKSSAHAANRRLAELLGEQAAETVEEVQP